MRDENLNSPSPTLSCSSADNALYELLGVDKLSLDQEEVDENDSVRHHTPTKEVSCLTPPMSCHRPQTPHNPLLLVCPNALSSTQCKHIISKGYQATNDGGAVYGPKYIKQAEVSITDSAVVTLEKPNHHKVVVFMDDMISKWINQVMEEHFDSYIRKWSSSNNEHYIINPRLRLLRYDAIDNDIFLSHYDATTTTTRNGISYESKLTILIYLNTEFDGGETAFLNSLNPSDNLDIKKSTGKVVVFNHELYHASRELIVNNEYSVDGIRGGTKFVLRTDVMFEQEQEDNDLCTASSSSCLLEMPTSDVEQVKVVDLVKSMETTNSTRQLENVLEELDVLHSSVRSFLVPSRNNLTRMLTDLGLTREESEAFLEACVETLE